MQRLIPGSFVDWLRLGGALMLIAAMCGHLLEGWSAWHDAGRYYVMLAGTLSLLAAGIFANHTFRAYHAARTLVGLALLSVIANVTTFAGLLHELVQWDRAPPAVEMLALSANSIWLMALAGLVLWPACWFAYRILARPHATMLTLSFAWSTLLLIVPVREPMWISGLLLLSLIAPLALFRQMNLSDRYLSTMEGRFALMSLFVPAAVMTARLLWLYDADQLFTLIMTVIALALTQTAVRLGYRHRIVRYPLTVLSFGWLLGATVMFVSLIYPLVADVLLLPLSGLFVAAGLMAMSNSYPSDHRRHFALGAALLLTAVGVLNSFLLVSVAGSLVSSALAVVLYVAVRRYGQGTLAGLSPWLATTVASVAWLPHALHMIGRVDFTSWITLAVMGALAIAIAVWFERRAA